MGRAHHRVLHFVNRHPGLRVADLLEILKITKQSLARVLKQLVDEGWIAQKTGEEDRRERLLRVTDKGAGPGAPARSTAGQARCEARWRRAGPATRHDRARFLFSMISNEERSRVEALLPGSMPTDDTVAAPRKSASSGTGSPMEPLLDNAPHILVVDDDQRIRDLLARYLFENGFRVTTAVDAATARASMRGLAFDVVILDVMMPGESGLDLARDLKGISNIPDLHADRAGGGRKSASRASRSASTTTSPSRSSRASCCCGCRTSSSAARGPPARATRSPWAISRSTSGAASSSAARNPSS